MKPKDFTTESTSAIRLMSVREDSDCAAPDRLFPTIIFFIRGIYGILSIFLYAVNILAMRRGKIGKTFFFLYSTCAVMSSLFFLEYWIVMQFLDLGYWCHFFWIYFAHPNFFLTGTRIISTYCPIAILVLHYFISLHRLITVISPLKTKYWDENIIIILTISLLTPFFFMWFVIPCKGFLVNYHVGGLDVKYERTENEFFCSFSSTFFSAIASILFGLLTLLNTVIILVALKMKSVSVSDFGMIYFEILMAVVTFLYAAVQASLYILNYQYDDEELQHSVELIRTFVVDVFVLPQSWTLLIFSRTVRNAVKTTVFGTKSVILPQPSTPMQTMAPRRASAR